MHHRMGKTPTPSTFGPAAEHRPAGSSVSRLAPAPLRYTGSIRVRTSASELNPGRGLGSGTIANFGRLDAVDVGYSHLTRLRGASRGHVLELANASEDGFYAPKG